MPERQEHQPGTHAPVSGHYEELNIFGTRPGRWSTCARANDCRTHPVAAVNCGVPPLIEAREKSSHFWQQLLISR